MLVQLVCIDRRYQRMNCFNIRELESLLKKRFFVDLVNTSDHHELLNKTAIGARYKLNTSDLITQNITGFYNYGIFNTPNNQLLNVNYSGDKLSTPTLHSLLLYIDNFFLS